MSDPQKTDLLLIFIRNPVLGQCKTRLARTVGDRVALDIYTFLLRHTAEIARKVDAERWVYYSDEIVTEDMWGPSEFVKKRQLGSDLGARMLNAFKEGFAAGFDRICVIGSDLYELSEGEIEAAFSMLQYSEAVIGPAEDGGYYLLGMKRLLPGVFEQKQWGGDHVFADTVAGFSNLAYTVLPVRNDVDYYEDIKDVEAFRPFLKNLNL